MSTATRAASGVTTAHARLPGPDVVRAVALIGVVVMNYYGYLLLRRDTRGDSVVEHVFDPWRGPLATRFAATFVLVAGVGVTLLTRRTIGDAAAVRSMRWTLVRRGLALYVGGLLLDEIWSGTILPYYGAMFAVAALLFTLRSRWVALVGATAALAGAAIAWWGLERRRDGHDTGWLFSPGGRSPRSLLFDVAVNGTHPLLPWLAFLCAGIVLGRLLATTWWRPVAIGGGLALFVVATGIASAAGGGSGDERWSTHPFDRGLLYTASALGTALAAYGIVSWLAERYVGSSTVRVLRDAGAMSLTLYVAHALVFNVLVDWLRWVRPTGLDTALAFAAVYWVLSIALAARWHRTRGIGPLEWLYRTLGG